MSRKGNPYDNALAESFVATLKTECFGHSIPRPESRRTAHGLRLHRDLLQPPPPHSSLGYRSPLDFEKQMFPPNKNN